MRLTCKGRFGFHDHLLGSNSLKHVKDGTGHCMSSPHRLARALRSCEPEINKVTFAKEKQYILLVCSDGVWDSWRIKPELPEVHASRAA